MPCDTVTAVRVDVSKMQAERLARALTADGGNAQVVGKEVIIEGHPTLGYCTLNMKTGKLTGSWLTNTEDINGVLGQSYGRQAVRDMAKKHGWQLSKKSATKFVVNKMSF